MGSRRSSVEHMGVTEATLLAVCCCWWVLVEAGAGWQVMAHQRQQAPLQRARARAARLGRPPKRTSRSNGMVAGLLVYIPYASGKCGPCQSLWSGCLENEGKERTAALLAGATERKFEPAETAGQTHCNTLTFPCHHLLHPSYRRLSFASATRDTELIAYHTG